MTEPTPRGTGVTAAATCETAAKSTSPVMPPLPSSFVPTSTTTAPGATMSAVTACARPMQLTSTSARLVSAARPRVLEWHTVTVALRASSSCATGLPTTRLLPSTATRAPASGTS